MYFTRKLKPAQLGSEFLIPLLALPVLLIIYFYWGQRASWGAIAIIESAVVVMHLNMFFQTKNKSFLWLAAAFGIIGIFAAFIAIYGLKKNDPMRIPFTVAASTAIVCIGYILFTKRVKWRTREILELAAMPVEEIKNGYTERPLSLGKIDATEYEIDAFSLFLNPITE